MLPSIIPLHVFQIKTSIRIYNNKPIRSIWEEKTNSWYYAAVDIISILTDSKNPKTYWPVFKKRHPQIITNCKQLKLRAFDGKMYVTDVLNENGIDELLYLLPSRNNENIKKWIKIS